MTTISEVRRPAIGTALRVSVLAYALLTVAYVVANRATPRPDATGAEVLEYAQTHDTAIKVGAVLLIASAAALAWSAVQLHRRVPTVIPLAGGLVATFALLTSAVLGWLVGDAAGASEARNLADGGFWSGGVAFAVAFAALVAGVTRAGLRDGSLPRAVTRTGLVLAATGLLCLLSPLVDGFSYLLPVVRFGGTIWLAFAAFLLTRTGTHASHRPNGSEIAS